MPVHIFISRPTIIGHDYEEAYSEFDKLLKSQGFLARRLGRTDYSKKAPIHAIIDIMEECYGAIILGYPQIEFLFETRRSAQTESTGHVFPTPWNQIEGALAFRNRAPVLVVAHKGVSGGVFDYGITGEMVLTLDLSSNDWFQKDNFTQPFKEWVKEVKKFHKAPGK